MPAKASGEKINDKRFGFGSPKPFTRKRPFPPGYTTGRPTLYQPEYCQRVVEVMGQGYDLTAFAGTIGVSRDAVYDWAERHVEFHHAVQRGKAARLYALQNKLLTTQIGVGVTASIFALKNAAPDEWQDRYNTETTITHRIEQVSDAQLLEIVARSKTIQHDAVLSLPDANQRQPMAVGAEDGAELGEGTAIGREVPEGENSGT